MADFELVMPKMGESIIEATIFYVADDLAHDAIALH